MASRRRTRTTRTTRTTSNGGGGIARYLLPAAALGIAAYLLWPKRANAAPPQVAPLPGPLNPLPLPPRPLNPPAPTQRDRLAREGLAMLNSLNPPTVTAAQLRAKAAELRLVQEASLADLLDGAANQLPG